MRLPRPYIPLSVRAQVAERQFDGLPIPVSVDPEVDIIERSRSVFRDFVDRDSWRAQTPAGERLSLLLRLLFGEQPKTHLDHDPALAARAKIRRNGVVVRYVPSANDPDFLVYREAGPHQIKTNVRGDHGQHPDRVLIKRKRRLERPKRKRRSRPIPARKNPWQKGRKLRSP